MIRLVHIIACLQCLLASPTYQMDHKIATTLRHIPWASTTQSSTFKLEYFDVSLTIPKSYTFNTISWNSDATEPFRLSDAVSTDGLFSPNEDPSEIVNLMNFDLGAPYDFGSSSPWLLDINDMPLYFSLLDGASCYSAATVDPPLIVDTGASVCITPLKTDFVTYRPSTMRIKDLSSSNTVAGEGQISWHVVDTNGKQVTLTVPGFTFQRQKFGFSVRSFFSIKLEDSPIKHLPAFTSIWILQTTTLMLITVHEHTFLCYVFYLHRLDTPFGSRPSISRQRTLLRTQHFSRTPT